MRAQPQLLRREARAHTLAALMVGISAICMVAALVGLPVLGLFTAGSFALLVLGPPLARRNLRALSPYFTRGLTTSVGQASRWMVSLENGTCIARDVRINLAEGRRDMAPLAAGWSGELVGPSQQVELHPRFSQRGHFSSIELELRSAWPLGWIEERCRWRVPTDLWVLPRIVRLSPKALQSMEAGIKRNDMRSHEGEIYALREWRAGEGLRSVSWKLSAHRGRRLVTERRRALALSLRVHLLCSMGSTPPTHSRLFESAVVLAASLLAHYAQAESEITLAIDTEASPKPAMRPAQGSGELLALMRQLALAKPNKGSLEEALAKVEPPRSDEVVWVISALDSHSSPPGLRVIDNPEAALEQLRARADSPRVTP